MLNIPVITKKEVLLLIFFISSCFIFFATTQNQISLNNGTGWDGSAYYKMASDFINDVEPEGGKPFIYRIGTPLLVSIFFSDDPMNGFKTLNVIFGALNVLLMYYWISMFVKNKLIRFSVVAYFALHYLSPSGRLIFFYPVSSDPLLSLLLLTGLIMIELYRRCHDTKLKLIMMLLLSIVSTCGIFAREVMLIIPITLITADLPKYNWRKYLPFKLSLVILCILIFGGISTFVKVIPSGYSFITAALKWGYERSIINYLHAWLIVFGPVLPLLCFNYRDIIDFFKDNLYLAVYIVFVLLLSYVGGSDTERFAFWAYPIIGILVGMFFEKYSYSKLGYIVLSLIVIGQIACLRLFAPIPDYAPEITIKLRELIWSTFLVPQSFNCPYFLLWSYHGISVSSLFMQFCFYQFCIYSILIASIMFLQKYKFMKDKQLKPVRYIKG